jgi:uncharacterized protein (TIGR02246 family)
MISTRMSRTPIGVILSLAGLTFGLAIGGSQLGGAGSTPIGLAAPSAQAAPPSATASDDRQTDREAIQKAIDGFITAFRKGDAKDVAAHWTAEGEYVSDDGTTFHGRPALEKAYTESFAKNPGNALEVEVDSVRFPSRDNAVVEGHFKLHRGKQKDLVVSRCSFLYAREDGKWLIAIARERPSDGLTLRDLEWLIGTWETNRNGTKVTTKYEWTANKSFIRCQFSITKDGKSDTGMQLIGKDPASGLLRVWTFEDSGGIGESAISRDSKKWVFTARGATADGRVLTATNILTPVDADSFLWQSVERALDDEELPDEAPVKVTRTQAKP